ncbi:MAG TPA: WD40 repeat domain-containing protein [Acidimicrobiia bacterium]|nr:WD40 repeat domain-containing protein [Acidimicrobiia bacterium]
MTQNKHFKALIRARMAKTGESYSISRSQLLGTLRSIKPDLVAEFRAHDKHVSAIAFVPGREELISGGFSGQARIWSTVDWTKVGELTGHTGSVNGFGISSDGSTVITASSDNTVRLWDLARRIEVATLGNHSKPVVAIDLSADASLAATGSYDGTVRIWSLADRSEARRIKIGERVGSVAFHPLKSWLAVASATSEVGVYDADGTRVAQLSASTPMTAVGWTGDGEFLIGVGGNAVRLWARDDWDEVRSFEVEGGWLGDGAPGSPQVRIAPFASNHDSSLLAAGWEHHVGVWRFDDDQPAAVIDGLPKGVYSLEFSEDGKMLGLGCADGRVRVWSI